jgi:hypothetical protein
MANSYRINLNANPVYKHIKNVALAMVPFYSYSMSILQLTSVHLCFSSLMVNYIHFLLLLNVLANFFWAAQMKGE